jgi:cobalamin biosynthesis Mg chelatase CobN
VEALGQAVARGEALGQQRRQEAMRALQAMQAAPAPARLQGRPPLSAAAAPSSPSKRRRKERAAGPGAAVAQAQSQQQGEEEEGGEGRGKRRKGPGGQAQDQQGEGQAAEQQGAAEGAAAAQHQQRQPCQQDAPAPLAQLVGFVAVALGGPQLQASLTGGSDGQRGGQEADVWRRARAKAAAGPASDEPAICGVRDCSVDAQGSWTV